MYRHPLAAGLLCLLIAAPAPAATSPTPTPAPAPASCANAANEQALLACRKKAHAAVTAQLAGALDTLKQRFQQDDAERARLLLAAQAKWEGYRDAECELQTFESRGGSAFAVYQLDCLTRVSRARLDDLRKLVATP